MTEINKINRNSNPSAVRKTEKKIVVYISVPVDVNILFPEVRKLEK